MEVATSDHAHPTYAEYGRWEPIDGIAGAKALPQVDIDRAPIASLTTD